MIAIVDYGAGNLKSLSNALTKIGQEWVIATNPRDLDGADKIILPGVGAAGSAMAQLSKIGFYSALKKNKKPLLGICLGMQLLSDLSEEDEVECLGLISGKVKKLPSLLKIPQMGWNRITTTATAPSSPFFNEIPSGSYFYFVHSYYFDAPFKFVTATTTYGIELPVSVEQTGLYGVQFHPEKSGEVGLRMLSNFCTLC